MRRLPFPVAALAILGAAFVVVPILALLIRAPWSGFGDVLGGEGSTTALRLSIVVSLAATGLSVLMGVPLAWLLARVRFPGKSFLRAAVVLPLVLPPVVGGVGLIQALGREGVVGRWLYDSLGIQLTFTIWGAIIAATFVSMPLVVLASEAGFRFLDPGYERAASALGARPGLVFRRVTLPLAAPQLAAGAILAWARALGEFGATITFAGNLLGKTQTLPLAVYQARQTDPGGAILLSLVLVVISVGVIAALGERIDQGSLMALAADLHVRRDGFRASAAFEVGDGETLALLGPNGAGKSTVLDALAGLLPLDSGWITLDGERIDGLPPERRPLGVAFQDPLLFPHLSALDNVAFPLRARGRARSDARAHAATLLGRVAPGVPPGAKPAALSGGERQRVALARALAPDPRLLLLDEPLAAVDVSARADLRALLREVVASFEGPCVLVVHDPVDALTLADRVAILEHGELVQVGTADEVRRSPATPYAADLVGVNLFRGRLVPLGDDAGTLETDLGSITVAWPPGVPQEPLDDVVATLRPADVALHLDRPEGSPRNVLDGPVAEIAIHGERARVRLRSSPPLVAEITLGSVDRLALEVGRDVFASFKAVEVRLMVAGVQPDTLVQ